jgi:protein-L-isoaspartate(D-aspartate) O-methyltransferase
MPYKGIIVTAGAPVTPKSLKKQLDSGGRLVVPVGDKKSQSLEIITRIDEKNYETESVPQFVFVPLIGREGWKQ